MPKKPIQKKLIEWKAYRLKGSPAAFIGVVYAHDEKAALKAAVKEFKITPDPRALLRCSFLAVKKPRRRDHICPVGDREVVSLSSLCRSDIPTCRGHVWGRKQSRQAWGRRRLCCL
jgi:hypothetical protein